MGAGIGLSFMTLMSQLFPSTLAVDHLSLAILAGYAIVAMGILRYLMVKELKDEKTEVVAITSCEIASE
ncbi:hypothetical protein [Sphingobacterium sp. IITKGP-BTPF85]|uniref:hypothetical protein n=1 Tax=Sphingobacterium sp. IITKGP-BTPF85 TaxID=1338009 RepID=UPI0018CDAC25|nr:hypothetical protein [Sphingobacterium sp. IITKGP-BTPF85]